MLVTHRRWVNWMTAAFLVAALLPGAVVVLLGRPNPPPTNCCWYRFAESVPDNCSAYTSANFYSHGGATEEFCWD